MGVQCNKCAQNHALLGFATSYIVFHYLPQLSLSEEWEGLGILCMLEGAFSDFRNRFRPGVFAALTEHGRVFLRRSVRPRPTLTSHHGRGLRPEERATLLVDLMQPLQICLGLVQGRRIVIFTVTAAVTSGLLFNIISILLDLLQ